MPAVQSLIAAAVSKFAPALPPARSRMRPLGAPLRALAAPTEGAYTCAGCEPPLQEILSDPIVRALMRSDGVEPVEVRRVLETAARRRLPPD